MGFSPKPDASGIVAPPSANGRDRFGLPLAPPTLLQPEKREARAATVRQLVADVFDTAVRNLGREEAETLFAQAPKRSRASRSDDDERNDYLLRAYDEMLGEMQQNGASTREIKSIPRKLGELLHADRDAYPPMPKSIEKQIRRLLRRRERLRQEQERFSLIAEKLFPPTLLTADRDK
jgi:hypothetical protein